MTTEHPDALTTALRRRFAAWHHHYEDDRIVLTKGVQATHRPPGRSPSWEAMLTALTQACADHGIPASRALPLSGLEDADLTFSAVQSLDPYLKHRRRHTYGTGFIPQPVVRFTGQRDARGALQPGFLSSFINASIVSPINDITEHTALIDAWIGVMSTLGFHARNLTISGSLTTWHRPPVSGITLRFHHQKQELGDAVLLWNTEDPSYLATDIGTGLERLRWALTGRPWLETVYGPLSNQTEHQLLDAVRTATLIIGSGIRPTSRGPGSAVRRALRSATPDSEHLGLSRVVRWAHHYWSNAAPLPVPWPEVCRIVDDETHKRHDQSHS